MSLRLGHEGQGPRDGDLLLLLQSIHFGHWHGLLLELVHRHQGWLADYEFEPTFDPDYRPLEQVISVLLQFPLAGAGDDRALALAIAECEFLFRVAHDRFSGRRWDCLTESYRSFKRSGPDVEPFWGAELPWPAHEFVAWALANLPRPLAPPKA